MSTYEFTCSGICDPTEWCCPFIVIVGLMAQVFWEVSTVKAEAEKEQAAYKKNYTSVGMFCEHDNKTLS